MLNPFKPFYALGLLFCLGACAPGSTAIHDNEKSDHTSGILKGTLVESRNTLAARAVIMIQFVDKSGLPLSICSGVLIGPNTVLTAGHCFDSKLVPGIAKFNVIFNEVYRSNSKLILREGLDYKVHPRYNTARGRYPVYDNDVAVAVFSGALPKNFAPAAIDSDANADYTSKTVTSYGYGRYYDFSGTPRESHTGGAGVLRKGDMIVDVDFKDLPNRYFTAENSATYICIGDSGGPQFYQQKNTLKVIGIHSTALGYELKNGASTCRGRSQITKVSYFYQWILEEQAKLLAKNNKL